MSRQQQALWGMPERTCTPTPLSRRWDGTDIVMVVAAIILIPAVATLALVGAWTLVSGWSTILVAISHVLVAVMAVALMGQEGRS